MAAPSPTIQVVKLLSVTPWGNEEEKFLVHDVRLECPFNYKKSFGDDNKIQLSFKLVHGRKKGTTAEQFTTDTIESALYGKKILLFLCGGPGEKNMPTQNDVMNNFLLDKGYWLLFPDYRGTGDSSLPSLELDKIKLLRESELKIVQDKIELLRHRDIVRDCESVRLRLLGQNKWTILAQSFGTWVTLTYLSFSAEGVKEVFMTGGPAPILQTPQDVYQRLFDRVIEANDHYYADYRDDVKKVKDIVKWLAIKGGVELPDGGGILTAQRFLCLGRSLGNRKNFKKFNILFDHMATDIDNHNDLILATLKEYKDADSWRLSTRPLYAVLHELQYCSNKSWKSNWAAQAVARKKEQFWWVNCTHEDMVKRLEKGTDEKLYLSSEMVYPFFFDTNAGLDSIKNVANNIANKPCEEDMYDLEALKQNKVRVTALSYKRDIHVDFEHSKETLGRIGGPVKFYEHPFFEHAAIRANAKEVMEILFGERGI
ncbi:Alpha/Beta hydrolase protein [Xylariaceae sp. AK1471]|nr:Alpha/Beta hydrolase protein [Xylariaceae sp. AK1471]